MDDANCAFEHASISGIVTRDGAAVEQDLPALRHAGSVAAGGHPPVGRRRSLPGALRDGWGSRTFAERVGGRLSRILRQPYPEVTALTLRAAGPTRLRIDPELRQSGSAVAGFRSEPTPV